MNATNPTFTNLRLVAILENLQVTNESTSLGRDVSPNHSRASTDNHLTSSVFWYRSSSNGRLNRIFSDR